MSKLGSLTLLLIVDKSLGLFSTRQKKNKERLDQKSEKLIYKRIESKFVNKKFD